jgi:hypothetical protein
VRRTALTGLLATLVAMVATTAGAALAAALGVSFQLPGAPEPIPIAGFGVMTGIWSVVGIVAALAVRRWAARPAERWVQVAVVLTALSLVPPLLTGAAAATVATLVVLHLVAAVVMVPALARSLSGEPAPGRLAVSSARG